jgi:hypothetical protein
MHLRRRDLFLVVSVAAAVTTPAFAQPLSPTVGSASGGKASASTIPDFSGIWVHSTGLSRCHRVPRLSSTGRGGRRALATASSLSATTPIRF